MLRLFACENMMFFRITCICLVLTVLIDVFAAYGQSSGACTCQRKRCDKQPDPLLNDTQLENVKKQLKVDEGYKEEIYNDSTGHLTFGIGHKITKDDPEHGQPVGTKVSKERIDEAFKTDVAVAMDDVLAIWPRANTYPVEVREILVNMAFNLGRTNLAKFKDFIAAVKAKDWNTAADEMVDSMWYGQVGDRAERLVTRMRAVE